MIKFKLATPILLSMLATSAYAGGASPFYLGATIGKSSVDNDANQLDNLGTCESAHKYGQDCRIGDDDNVGHIYGGFQVSESVAIEIGYTDLGNTASYYYDDPIDIDQETDGFTVAGVVKQRVSKTSPLHVYGKAGLIRWTTETTSHDNYPGKTKDSGVSPMAGVGMEYELSHNVSLRAGWDRYFDVGEEDTLLEHNEYDSPELNTLETDVDVYSAGVNFSFL